MILGHYWQIYPQTILLFLFVLSIVALLNHFTIPRLGEFPSTREWPRVSILVPARDEEENIGPCVESLLRQDYPHFEVLVLDDHSTDRTRLILEQMAQDDSRLQVISGEPLPQGWLGKHWANHQLGQRATGDLLLFTDADTRHKPGTLRDAVSALIAQRLDLLTVFPREEMLTWGERLTVPILAFSIFCFFPMLLATKLRIPAVTVTIGQFMLFRRQAFQEIGGYKSVRGDVVDDVILGRRTAAMGFVWQLMDGTRHVSCRMYRDLESAWAGFTKNLFALFDYRIVLYGIGWLWIGVSFLLPPLVLVFPELGRLWNIPTETAVIAVSQALLIFAIAYHRFRLPMYLVLLYPLNMVMFILLAVRSLLHAILGYSSWKGRELPPPTLRF
jgi:chlorobactene glucosyltransferase